MQNLAPVAKILVNFSSTVYLCKFEINGKIYLISVDYTMIDNKYVIELNLKSLTYNGNDGFTVQNEKTIYINSTILVNHSFVGYVTKDNSKFIVLQGQLNTNGYTVSSGRIFVVDINAILFAENGSTIDVKQTITCPELNSGYESEAKKMAIAGNTNDTRIQVIAPTCNYNDKNKFMKTLKTDIDENNLIAVKYKNEYFSKVQPQTLSAGVGDVKAGKTFIGWMGYPETGTMEVE